jgi:SWI/SNF-related matrix-associated actin-dependent regulator 1 of chromatin subfamily A
MLELRPYQREGAAFLAARDRALIADAPRVGKTAQCVAACDVADAQSVLVLCPASAVPGWEREFSRFTECPPRLTVMSYDKAVRAGATLASRAINPQFLSMHVDALILDEAHYLKNPKAKRTKLVYGPKCDGRGGLVEKAKRVYAVTGTPMPKDASELFPMMRALAPERIRNPKTGLPYNFWQFVTKYCVVKNNGFGLEIKGTKNHDELRKMLDGFMIRRTLADVSPEMPELIYDTLPVDAKFPKGVPSSEIEMARKALADGGIEGLNAIGVHIATLRRLTGIAKVRPVAEWVKTHFECGGGKLVLFAHHTAVLHGLNDELISHGEEPRLVDGKTGGAVRQSEIEEFQTDPTARVFLGQLQAAGTAIRLDAADQVLFVESSWVPSDNFQASQRILDATKTAGCLARFVCIPGSIDEDIMRVAARRAEDAQKILD